MRILAIRGENLASLQGAFELDLEGPPLGAQGLIAVTGPTGAGKSTLLDALCLALFDRTPRLRGRGGSVVGFVQPEDRDELSSADPRCLIRRGAVEARAEVEFLGKLGRRYRATWRARRARRASTGRLQDQSLELHDLTTDRPLGGHRKSDTLAAISEALGLDWGAFGRAALLAQGEFAAFLRADPGERAELLERVTGTALYSRISVAAHRRAGETARALAALEERLAALVPLPDELRAALEARRTLLRGEREAARSRRDALGEALRHLRAIEEAGRDEARAASALREAEAAWADAAPLREALAEAEALEPLRAPLRALDQAERAESEAARELARAEQDAAQAEQAAAALRERAAVARSWLEAHEPLRALGEEWPRWSALLQRCQELLEAERATARQADERAARAAQGVTRLAAVRREWSARVDEVAASERAVAAARAGWPGGAGPSPAAARAALAGREQALAGLAPARERALRARRGVAEASDELRAGQDAAARAGQALASLEASGHALRVRREEAARASQAARAALDLEARRSELTPGAPCPLCGATAHPWAADAPPLVGLVREAAARLEELEQALAAHHREELEQRAARAAAEARLEAARAAACAHADELAAVAARWADLGRTLEAATWPDDPAADAAAAALEAARSELARARAQLLACEQEEERARSALDAAREAEAAAASALRAAESDEQVARSACEELERSRARDALERARLEEQLAPVLDRLPRALLDPAGAEAAASDADAAPEAGPDDAGQLPLFAGLRRPAPASVGAWRAPLRADPGQARARWGAAAEAWRDQLAARHAAERALGPAEATRSAAEARQSERRAAASRAAAERAAREAELNARLEAIVGARSTGTQAAVAAPLTRLRVREVLGLNAGSAGSARGPEWAARTRVELGRLERRGHEAAARLELLRLRREELLRRAPPPLAGSGQGSPEADLQAALAEAGRTEAGAAEALLSVEADLERDQRLRAERAALEPELALRRAAAGTWGQLGGLIGSHDGRKLRVFAQGLGLDALLEHTNGYLARLAPRYRLLRAPGQDLQLQLLDRELGDEVRPVSGLSGGESFLVSLGLALGLSSLHAGGTRIESLFIDEGLGALDPLAQEQALATLDALQADGRQVVLITHLPGIAERLGPGVRLVPLAQGRSRVLVG